MQFDQLGAPLRRRRLDRTGVRGEREQFLAHLGVEQIQVEVFLVKVAHLVLVVEIVDGLLVALAHLHQVGRELAASSDRARRDKLSKSPPCRRTESLSLASFLERFENVLQLRAPGLLVVGQVLQPDVLRAEGDQDLVQLDVVVDVLLALLALDLVERRLRDVDLPCAHQLGHLPVEKGQRAGCECASRPRRRRS